MADTISDEELLSAIQTTISDEELLSVIQDPFEEEEEEQRSYRGDVYTSEDYYETPGSNPVGQIAKRAGITSIDEDHPIYRQLMTDPAFREAEPDDRRRMFYEALDQANQEIYNDRGEKSETAEAFGLDMRTQKVTNEDGETQTYVVPGPSSQESGRTGRILAGGLSEAAKGLARVGEGITDAIGAGADALGINEALEDTGVRIGTDPETDYMKENFPTVPPEDLGDEIGQEIVSILVGSAGGAGLASKLEKAANLSPKAAAYAAKQWSKIGKKKPEELYDAAQVFYKTLIIGTGANIGATATTPETTEQLFGDDIIEALGFDAEENRNLANFADNAAFSAGLTLLGRLVKKGGKVGAKLIPAKILQKAGRDREIGALLLKEIDPNLQDVPAEVFAERARILGEVMRDNKTFRANLLADTEIDFDSTTALYKGAEEYVRRAYGWQLALMSEEAFEEFVEKTATTMRSKMTDIRQGRVTAGSNTVRDADRSIVEGFDEALDNTMDELGGQAAVEASAETMAKPIIENVGESQRNLKKAITDLEAADAALDEATNQNAIIRTLEESRKSNTLGSDQTERALLETLTGDQLYKAWAEKRGAYKEAFKNLPEADVALEDMIAMIEEAGARTNGFDAIATTSLKEDPLAALLKEVRPKTTNGVTETTEEVIERLSNGNSTFRTLFTRIRPQVELRIRYLVDNSQDASALIDLKRGIDELAKAADPAYGEALDLYADYAGTFLATDALRQFSSVAKEVNPKLKTATGDVVGLADAYQAGMDAFNISVGPNAVSANTDAFIAALNSGAKTVDSNPELAAAMVGQTINMLNRSLTGGAGANSAALISAVSPYLKVLELADPNLKALFDDAVDTLRTAESGLIDAKKAQKKANDAYLEILKKSKLDAASKFVSGIDSNPAYKSNPQAAFNELFNSAEAPARIEELIAAADRSGDPLVREGIQAQYLSWLKETLKTGRRFGGDTQGRARELSAAKLDRILRDPSSPVLRSLDVLFADTPQRAAQIVALLDVQDLALTGRAGRGSTFGSNTAYDQQIQKFVNRINVVLFGVLNPTATVARNVTQAVTENYRKGIQQDVLKTLDLMIADPDEFNRVMTLIEDDKVEQAIDIMSKHLGRGAYGAGLPLEDQMEEAMPE